MLQLQIRLKTFVQKVCVSMSKQNVILELAMTDIQAHFSEADWMQFRRSNTRLMDQDYSFAGGRGRRFTASASSSQVLRGE